MNEHERRAGDDGRHYYVKVNGQWVCQICGDVK